MSTASTTRDRLRPLLAASATRRAWMVGSSVSTATGRIRFWVVVAMGAALHTRLQKARVFPRGAPNRLRGLFRTTEHESSVDTLWIPIRRISEVETPQWIVDTCFVLKVYIGVCVFMVYYYKYTYSIFHILYSLLRFSTSRDNTVKTSIHYPLPRLNLNKSPKGYPQSIHYPGSRPVSALR